MEGIVFNILYSVLLAAAAIIIIFNLGIIEYRVIKKIKYFLICFSIYFFSYSINNYLALPLTLLILTWYIYLEEKNIVNSFMIAIYTNIIIAVSDALAGIILINTFKLSLNAIKDKHLYYILLHILLVIISFIISIALKQVLIKKEIIKDFFGVSIKKAYIILLYAVLALSIIYLNAMMYRYVAKGSQKLMFYLNVCITVSFFILTFLITYLNGKQLKKQLTYEYRIMQLEQLKEYTSNIENMSNDLRKFRHDYINILSTITGYTEEKDLEGLEKYLNEKVIPLNSKVNMSNKGLSLLQHIKISELKGLLSSKITRSQACGIDINVEIKDSIQSIAMDVIDICRTIGILFDNAIEAAEQCDIKKVGLAIIKDDNYVVFIIQNTFSSDISSIYKLYENGYSTKGNNRGMGLNIVKQILDERYPNVLLNTKIENGLFTQELVINNVINGGF